MAGLTPWGHSVPEGAVRARPAGLGVARAFGATRTPEAFVFDGAGTLVSHGAIDDNHESAEKVSKRSLSEALAAVVGG